MKKLAIILGFLFALQTGLFAQVQVDNDIVVFNAHLLQTFNLTVVNGNTQEITFAVAADYNNGVIEAAGIAPGTSLITVEATDIWNLTIECPDFLPGGTTPGGGVIEIENLGVYCTQSGTYSLSGECDCPYISPATILPLTNAAQLLIDNGSGNAGDASNNSFTLHWEMGTLPILQAANTPANGSMFDQMTAGEFTIGDFTTTATLTLFSLP